MLPEQFADFAAAAVKASPHGLTIVEDAIDLAVSSIDHELVKLDHTTFGADGFIPVSAFGAADRSPELALHHTRAHAVIEKTLIGVKQDLARFRDACVEARALIVGADEQAGDASRILVARVLAEGTTGTSSDDAYNQAVHTEADAVPTEENPDAPETPVAGAQGGGKISDPKETP
ncbi:MULTISPECIES: hypothetical protein [unclassified Nocardioides]|uniref:hypothetical protein n=1 Tax=unclassified Nocardioides TaxID=2615069 RepID=UPI0006F2DBAF|nr:MULTISPECIES: hypothetical protein [unclassified Nocardioides]KRA31287.1 hypothetical protein ASD81_17730 [Nocardioides sp. Root614]KRA87908.1 hypothetical protein ASD84_18005 [Nocardioides sp. Root682]